MWYKRISSPFQTNSKVIKNNFDVTDLSKQHNYNNVFDTAYSEKWIDNQLPNNTYNKDKALTQNEEETN